MDILLPTQPILPFYHIVERIAAFRAQSLKFSLIAPELLGMLTNYSDQKIAAAMNMVEAAFAVYVPELKLARSTEFVVGSGAYDFWPLVMPRATKMHLEEAAVLLQNANYEQPEGIKAISQSSQVMVPCVVDALKEKLGAETVFSDFGFGQVYRAYFPLKQNPRNLMEHQSANILVEDTLEQVLKKISKAYCPDADLKENAIIQLIERLVFMINGSVVINEIQYNSYLEFETAFLEKKVSP